VALKRHQCGSKTITSDDDCSFFCSCYTHFFCHWQIVCSGLVVGDGWNKPRVRPKEPTISVDGVLGDLAEALSKEWRRQVVVPRERRNERVTRRVKGTPEQMAEALGLKLRG
jgi:hypothetical protein